MRKTKNAEVYEIFSEPEDYEQHYLEKTCETNFKK